MTEPFQGTKAQRKALAKATAAAILRGADWHTAGPESFEASNVGRALLELADLRTELARLEADTANLEARALELERQVDNLERAR